MQSHENFSKEQAAAWPLSDHELRTSFAELGFITASPNVLKVLQQARKAAEVSDITILLEGETGTGKQVLAHAIHQLDLKRRNFPFITVHCSTITEALAESELFGHQRGSFSGAVGDRKGLFQAAQHGTLLLDDVNDLPAPLQPKLLDVIQRGILRPVGADREMRIDVRIIAACNKPLEPLVRSGQFRSDLYHRLNVVKLALPPFRDRGADLEHLIVALAARHSGIYSPIESVEPQLLAFLASYPFPGNVRELENTVQRMLFHKAGGTSLTLTDWIAQAEPERVPDGTDPFTEAAGAVLKAILQGGTSYAQAFLEIEKRILKTAIGLDGSTRREIAQRLHTSERTLYYKMKNHGLSGSSRA